MQLISYLDALQPRKRSRKIEIPVALVFTKADLCEDRIRNPRRSQGPMPRRSTTSVWHGWSATPFYFSGVAGSTAG